ncbi:hypothetical protein K474DRAFT_1699640 [Panus rudis PR-1116 ss-1]|nr:hypothetical protein K474DRAFT_1699640 [Panus rudis PR-1116 ss-1]
MRGNSHLEGMLVYVDGQIEWESADGPPIPRSRTRRLMGGDNYKRSGPVQLDPVAPVTQRKITPPPKPQPTVNQKARRKAERLKYAREALIQWRKDQWFSNKTRAPQLILDDSTLKKLANRANLQTVQDIKDELDWLYVEKYGEEVLRLLKDADDRWLAERTKVLEEKKTKKRQINAEYKYRKNEAKRLQLSEAAEGKEQDKQTNTTVASVTKSTETCSYMSPLPGPHGYQPYPQVYLYPLPDSTQPGYFVSPPAPSYAAYPSPSPPSYYPAGFGYGSYPGYSAPPGFVYTYPTTLPPPVSSNPVQSHGNSPNTISSTNTSPSLYSTQGCNCQVCNIISPTSSQYSSLGSSASVSTSSVASTGSSYGAMAAGYHPWPYFRPAPHPISASGSGPAPSLYSTTSCDPATNSSTLSPGVSTSTHTSPRHTGSLSPASRDDRSSVGEEHCSEQAEDASR